MEDDHRSAILPRPVATLDGLPFYLSVKGVGSSTEPFAERPLDRARAAEVTDTPEVRSRLDAGTGRSSSGGVITGELWLRGSPYGGQGLAHARTALAVSERAELTDLHGFRIAPVVKVALLPPALEERLRSIHWYRRFPGRMAQELRLLPSNVRVYFHARTTVGHSIGPLFDKFGLDTPTAAFRFERNFLRSGLAVLTLFARTLAKEPVSGRYLGLDFHDVWLDKDAVVAPDGTVYFVDLEGIEPVRADREEVGERIEDQIYRSLYELMFAYEQIERERSRRFGEVGGRKEYFASLVREAVEGDPFLRAQEEPGGLVLLIRNLLGDEGLNQRFALVDL